MSGHKNNNFPSIIGGDFHPNNIPDGPNCDPTPVCTPSDPTDDSNSNSNTNTNTNHLDNSICNSVDNCVTNNVETTVNVDVNACVNLDPESLSSPVIDLSNLDMATSYGSIIMPDVVTQHLEGDYSNAFNIDQVNNLVDNDHLESPTVTYNGAEGGGSGVDCWPFGHEAPTSPGGFSMEAHLQSGDSSIQGASSGATSSADATLNQDAFTQTITQGANIQFNSLTIQAAGHDFVDDHSLGHG